MALPAEPVTRARRPGLTVDDITAWAADMGQAGAEPACPVLGLLSRPLPLAGPARPRPGGLFYLSRISGPDAPSPVAEAPRRLLLGALAGWLAEMAVAGYPPSAAVLAGYAPEGQAPGGPLDRLVAIAGWPGVTHGGAS